MNTPNPLQSIPPYASFPPVNRTSGPVKVFGIIYAILAVFSIIGFFVMVALAVIPGFASHDYGSPDVASSAAPKILFGSLALIIGLGTLLHAVTAYGLLALKPWGRTLAIVASIITLVSIPIGTCIGAFALYYLMRQGAEQEYARLVYEREQPLPNPYIRQSF